jgi:FAD/FMN-containing dehydrogenase
MISMVMPHRSEDLTRRRVLAGSSALTIGAAVGGALPNAALGRQAPQPSEAAWAHLADQVSGPILRTRDFDLRPFARPFNLRYAADLPDAIAFCRGTEDVAAAITWCRENDFPLAVLSGGHCYAGYSMRKGGLTINLLLMREASYSNGTVRIGGGTRNREFYALLRQHDLAATHGRCAGVGTAGFLLGGGIGFNMRAYGAGCDQVVVGEIVTADGKVRTLTADADKAEADLFWACRGGGGGNFGVSTAFTLQPFEAAPVTVFDMTWSAAHPEPRQVLATLMKALDSAPAELGTRLSVRAPSPRDRRRGGDVTINLIGQLHGGSASRLDQILADVHALAKPQHATIWEQVKYWDGQKLLEEHEAPSYFQERSAFLASSLGDEAIELAFGYLRSWPGTSRSADLRFFQTGGKMNAPATDATAFVHRGSRWLFDVALFWSAADHADVVTRNRDWQDRFYQTMRRFSSGGAYQNFADPSLRDWRTAYYAGNLSRLESIKQTVDPDRLFDFPQAL